VSSKRNPQTAAKRAREQAVREKRELKAAKKLARKQHANGRGDLFTSLDRAEPLRPADGEPAREGPAPAAPEHGPPGPEQA
jgi:hypothetical protein